MPCSLRWREKLTKSLTVQEFFSEIIDRKQEESGAARCKFHRRAYSIKELKAMRFFNVSDQKRRWKEVHHSLGSDVVKEYDALRSPNQQTKKQKKKTTATTGKRFMEEPGMGLDNGVKMEDKGLKVDADPECVFSVCDLEKKREAHRNGASEIQDVDGRMKKGKGICGNNKGWSYSRSEIEALRFVNVSKQARWWKKVYHKISSDIVEEFGGLWIPNNRKQQSRNACRQQSTGKKTNPSKHLGEVLVEKPTTSPGVLNVSSGADVEEPLDEYDNFDDEDNSSSDEYDSIQRPAFFVEGEPDFESGPPLDGLEYLRRVRHKEDPSLSSQNCSDSALRWEAAQIPKVKVVRLNSSKLTNEQSAYMPSIPEIPKCPPNLLPSKDWESAFLADFSELRQGISVLENCNELHLNKVGKFPGKQSDCIQQLKQNAPTFILRTDAVSRAAALRNSISSLETASVLSRDDCLWLFALCAAVDTPLHGDTCASLRILLRKCSGLLALKSEHRDEVAMLSILITIAGKYFGQLDSL